MRLYEMPVTLTLRFEDMSERDMQVRRLKLRGALIKITKLLLDRYGVALEFEIGRARLLGTRVEPGFEDEEIETCSVQTVRSSVS